MSSIVNLRTGLGPVLGLFGAKDRRTSPLIKARTVPTLIHIDTRVIEVADFKSGVI